MKVVRDLALEGVLGQGIGPLPKCSVGFQPLAGRHIRFVYRVPVLQTLHKIEGVFLGLLGQNY